MADDILKNIPLPADLPENWTSEQTVAPTGAEVGMDEQHGYNYLMKQVNNAQKAAKAIAATLLNYVYPVGSLYMSTDPTSPASLFGGSWESIASERVLMGASGSHAAGTTVDAGLPNITGQATFINSDGADNDNYPDLGAFYFSVNNNKYTTTLTSGIGKRDLRFDASRVSSIYGKSATVQPPAYYVYMWRRTA